MRLLLRLLLLLLQYLACAWRLLRRAAAAAHEPLQAAAGPGEGGRLIRWWAGRDLRSTSLSGTLPESIGAMTQLHYM